MPWLEIKSTFHSAVSSSCKHSKYHLEYPELSEPLRRFLPLSCRGYGILWSEIRSENMSNSARLERSWRWSVIEHFTCEATSIFHSLCISYGVSEFIWSLFTDMIYIFHLKPLKDQRERNKSYNISSWTPKATQQLFAFERVSGVCV